VKVICGDYQRRRGGRKGCRHFIGAGGLCTIPNRVRCIQWLLKHQDQTSIQELLSHSEFPAIPCKIKVIGRSGDQISIKPGAAMRYASGILKNLPWIYSFSQIYQCYLRCPRKWYLTYLKRVSPITKPHWFPVGSAGHAVLEKYADGLPIKAALEETRDFEDEQVDDKYYLYRLASVRAACRAWADRHEGIRLKTEVYHSHPLLPMRGYVDGEEETQEGDLEAWEHKFTGGLGYKPIYRGQALFYFGIEARYTKVHINLVKKAAMNSFKPKAGQGVEAYEERIFKSIQADPSKWFEIHTIERNDREVEQFNLCTLQVIDQLETAKAACYHINYFPRNYNECHTFLGPCEFCDLCESGRLDPRFYVVEAGKGGRARDLEEHKRKAKGVDEDAA
jgi:hypothetical protein